MWPVPPSARRHRPWRGWEADKIKYEPGAAGSIWKGGAAEGASLAADGEGSDSGLVAARVTVWVRDGQQK